MICRNQQHYTPSTHSPARDGRTHRREIEMVKDGAACFPYGRVTVFLHALVVESVHLSDLPTLVVSSEQGDPIWISGFPSAIRPFVGVYSRG